MRDESMTSPACSGTDGLSTVTVPSAPTCSIRTSVAFSIVADCSDE